MRRVVSYFPFYSNNIDFVKGYNEGGIKIYILQDAKSELEIKKIKDVRGNLTLPTRGKFGAEISWFSENSAIITTSGEIIRPKYGEGDIRVKLNAAISLNGKTVNKEFEALVREMPRLEEFKGYLFSYFIGEDYEKGEQIYFALSEGNNPLMWREINNGCLVFSSKLGEKGLRDPFIIRSPEGGSI